MGVTQYLLPRWPKEQELEESIQNLLNHLVILLFGTEHILQELDQVGFSDHLSSDIISAHCTAQHHAFENHIIFSVAGHQLRLQKVDNTLVFHSEFPLVGWDVDHSSKQFNKHISVLLGVDCIVDIVFQVLFKGLDRGWIKLGHISANFEKEGILTFKCTLNKLLVLLFLG